MKVSFVTFIFLSLGYSSAFLSWRKRLHQLPPPPPATEKLYSLATEWFDQKLDHFQPTNNDTWRQKYFVNDEYYESQNPGPVFIFIGGEGAASPGWIMSSSMADNAKKYKALCFLLEHRYYGASRPTKDISEENLKYLSSKQALADTANFITAMNKKYKLNKDVKWIAFGGSYAGSLVAWLRLKYPSLVHGAVSSSGPLLAKYDFQEYFQVVISSLREKTGSDDCGKVIKAAITSIESAIKDNPKLIDEKFKLCESIGKASKDDISIFYETLADPFAGLVQYNDQAGNSIINECKILTDESSGTALERLAKYVEKSYNVKCLSYNYLGGIEYLKLTTYDYGIRQWFYQVCTEFSFLQTSTGVSEYFGDHFPIQFLAKQCQDVFGSKYNEDFIKSAVEKTNKEYGGLNIKESNVVYVHGTIDPWHALGITKTIHKDAPAILINGTSHCYDMYPAKSSDSPELKRAHEEVEKLIGTWLKQ